MKLFAMFAEANEEGVRCSQARQQTHFLNPNIQSGNQQVGVSSNIAPITGTYRGLIIGPRLTTLPVHYRIIIAITVFCCFVGIFFGNMGEWHHGVFGVLGISFIVFGIVAMLIVAFYRLHHRNAHVNSGAASEAGTGTLAGTMHPNTTGPTATLQQGVPNPTQAGGTTSFVLKTSGMQSGWDAMGKQAYHTQLPAGNPVGNSTAQIHAHPTQNFSGTPYHPPPIGALQYPQPTPTNSSAAPMTNPSTGATVQLNYPVMHSPPPAETFPGMPSQEDGLPPPPLYDDVFSSS